MNKSFTNTNKSTVVPKNALHRLNNNINDTNLSIRFHRILKNTTVHIHMYLLENLITLFSSHEHSNWRNIVKNHHSSRWNGISKNPPSCSASDRLRPISSGQLLVTRRAPNSRAYFDSRGVLRTPNNRRANITHCSRENPLSGDENVSGECRGGDW